MDSTKMTTQILQEPNKAERKQLFSKLNDYEKNLKMISNELKNLVVKTKPKRVKFKSYGDTIMMTFLSVVSILCALLLLHCAVWVLNLIFNIKWNTWGWITTTFWWGLGITTLVTIGTIAWYYYRKAEFEEGLEKYKEYVSTLETLTQQKAETDDIIKTTKKQITDSLTKDVKEIVEIPIDRDSIKIQDRKSVEKILYNVYDLRQKYQSAENIEERDSLYFDLANMKLDIFYRLSIKGEASLVYPVFENQLKQAQETENWGALRVDSKDEIADMHFHKLSEYTALLSDNRMTPILKELNEVNKLDTKNFFGMQNVDALAEKTVLLQDLYKAARYEYKELSKLNHNINYLLEFVRVCAYKNIYLGAELLNYIRNNAGGKSLTSEKDFVDIKLELVNIDVPLTALKMDAIGNITNSVNNCIDVGMKLLDDKGVVDFIMKNPKTAAGITLVSLVGDVAKNYFDDRNAKIQQNNKVQKNTIENIKLMVDNYTKGQGGLLRAIEIIKAITQANRGFMQVYEPLKQKVFEEHNITAITMQDIQQLALATNEYNKISKAKI